MERVGPSGETILDYSVYDAIQAGFDKVLLVIRKSLEHEVKVGFENRWPEHPSIDYVFQELKNVPQDSPVFSNRKKPWGTGQAVLVAESKINKPFAVINADDFYGRRSFLRVARFLASLKKKEVATYCIIGYKLARTLSDHGAVTRGICETDADGYLKSIIETPHISKTPKGIVCRDPQGHLITLKGGAVVSMNLMGLTPSFFKYAKFYFERFLQEHGHNPKAEFLLPDVVNKLVKGRKARVKILSTEENWFGVTYRQDKVMVASRIRELVNKGVYPEKLWDR